MKKQFITRVFLSSLVLALTSLFGGGNLLAQTDILTASKFAATSTGYKDFSDVTAISSAVYAGNSAKHASGAIQLRSKNNNSGIVTTTSGGKVTKIVLEWESSTTAGRTIDVYGKKSAYLNATDLYSTSKQGTYIGSIIKGESTTLNVTDDYEYIGLRSKDGALYLTSVEITWASSSDPTDKRTDPGLDYGVSECNATIGQTEGFPTLSYAEGVTGITYSSSDETVATVDASGNVTLNGIVGTTTITASFPGNETWKDGEASYTLNVSKRSANLTYSASSCTVIVGETPELPTLSNPEGVEGIVYASSNTAVATVNETTGAVTLTGAEGTTVISATFEGNATFANGSASYTLTVTKTNTYRYKKVTATEKLMDGGQYIIVCEDLNLAKGPGSGTGSVEVNIDGEMIIPTESAALGVYTLKAVEGGYALKIDDVSYLGSTSKTDFSSKDTPVAWTVTIDPDKNAFIQCSTSDSRQILFSGTNCKNYSVSNAGKENYYYVQLYQKVYPLTVSSATGGYATFYNEEEAYKMPEGLTGYAVTKAEAGDCITRKTAYEAGATVPAKTPLLIIGTTDGGNYYPAVVSGTGVEAYAGSNLLEGTRDANGYTSYANDGSVYYYKLGLNAEKQLGFYWGAEGGAAFQMQKATTAYLAVPKTLVEGANALFFDFGPETGINEIQTEQADKAIFDLSGRRVQKATKGFYIVGGKKVLVK